MILILILLVLSSTTRSFEETNTDLQDTDLYEYILCRSCGSNVSASSKLVSVSSPESRYAFNDTVFGKEVLIQVLSIGLIFDYPVITVTQSNCVSDDGEWEQYDAWFPGYKWKICTCPDCGDFVGWVFEPLDPEHKSNKPFYGLILSNLIGESCKYIFIGRWLAGVRSVVDVYRSWVYVSGFWLHMVLDTIATFVLFIVPIHCLNHSVTDSVIRYPVIESLN